MEIEWTLQGADAVNRAGIQRCPQWLDSLRALPVIVVQGWLADVWRADLRHRSAKGWWRSRNATVRVDMKVRIIPSGGVDGGFDNTLHLG